MGILTGMRVVEGSAFVAIPLAGMTLAQMGAEVIRFDRLEGGLDAARWPVTPSGRSLFWAGMNKGKKSVAVDLSNPAGRELVTRIITAPGPDVVSQILSEWDNYSRNVLTEGGYLRDCLISADQRWLRGSMWRPWRCHQRCSEDRLTRRSGGKFAAISSAI